MLRPRTRRTLRLETLESRALLSSGGPTAQEQYMLELINTARTNPAEMATWIKSNIDANVNATLQHYGVDLDTALQQIAGTMPMPSGATVTPVQPLAWNDTLAGTAQEQSQYEADNQVQTHQGPGEADLQQRLASAPVPYTNPAQYGENSYAYAESVDHAMKAFLIDWGVSDLGHRGNLLQPGTPDGNTYSEVGIGIVATSPGSKVGPFVMTQDFGRPANFQPQVVGVVYNDQNGNHMYDPGEGQGNVTIEVDDMSGHEVASTTTWDQGGYQIPLAPGSYKVTAIDNGQVVQSQNVTVGGDNVKVDFDTSQPWQGGPLPGVANQSQSQGSSDSSTSTDASTSSSSSSTTPTPTPTTTAAATQANTQINQANNNLLVAVPSLPNMDPSWLDSWKWWN